MGGSLYYGSGPDGYGYYAGRDDGQIVVGRGTYLGVFNGSGGGAPQAAYVNGSGSSVYYLEGLGPEDTALVGLAGPAVNYWNGVILNILM